MPRAPVLCHQRVLSKKQEAAAARTIVGQQKQADRQYEDDVTMRMMKLSNREASFAQRPDSADDVTGDSVRHGLDLYICMQY